MMDEVPSRQSAASGHNFYVLPDPAKLEAMAEFAAGAGHEINNPLATIIGRAQLLLKDEQDPQRRQMLSSIGAQAYRIRDMIGDTMLFARPPEPQLATIKLADAIVDVIEKQGEELTQGSCELRLRLDPAIHVRADATQLSVVLGELLRNSRQALDPEGGEIQISTSVEKQNAVISIVDHGKGFTPVEQTHAFDPFFSGRQAGRGLGFGLPKCWRIVELHGGQIEIESSAGGPTTVRVAWPIAS